MGARTSGREAALQMLFALESSGDDVETVITRYWRSFEGHPESRGYAEEIVRGVAAHLAPLDARLRAASHNWRLERMTRVDRNVLRLGAWELAHKAEVPRPVVLDEAVELAKSFGTLDSGAFVNGVLDRVADELSRR
ncbi:MAG: transcription antitermination factor NusB [Polyangiaceae bacterium]|nr:transcription antitermination factor NusB [Polyangiaceae bacterium]